MSDILEETIDTLTELKRMHQLNFELIEQLNIACQFIVDNNVSIPNELLLRSLVGKSLSLISQMQAKESKTLIYKKLSEPKKLADEKKHLFKTDEEGTESLCLSFLQFSVHRMRKCFNRSIQDLVCSDLRQAVDKV